MFRVDVDHETDGVVEGRLQVNTTSDGPVEVSDVFYRYILASDVDTQIPCWKKAKRAHIYSLIAENIHRYYTKNRIRVLQVALTQARLPVHDF